MQTWKRRKSSHASTQMNFEDIMQSKMTQSKKANFVWFHSWNIFAVKRIETESSKVTAKDGGWGEMGSRRRAGVVYCTWRFSLAQWKVFLREERKTLEYSIFHKDFFGGNLARGFLDGTGGKELICQCRRQKRPSFNSWVGKIPWRRVWQPTPVFLPEKSHGQRSLVGYNPRVAESRIWLKWLSRHTYSLSRFWCFSKFKLK